MIREDIRLGRIAGIPVGINWSVLLIVALLTWILASSVLPEAAPGVAGAGYWLAGVAGSLLFLSSLLAHELAHAVVARRAGLRVEGMTLWLLGGIAQLGGDPPDAGTDFRIAAVGPATSLGFSVGFGATAGGMAALGVPDIAVAVAAWLAAINLVLAVFNLVPGAPLDGGRILRALLWRRHGDRARAAISAARAGQVVGYGLIGLGVLEFVAGGSIGGLWMVFVGWFVLAASQAERDHVVAEAALRGVRVRDVMTRSPHTAPAGITVEELIERYLLGSPHSAYPVEGSDGRISGIVTLRQLRAVPLEERTTARVGGIAMPLAEVRTVGPDDQLSPLLPVRDNPAGGRILVVDQNELVGIVTPTDIARAVDVRTMHSRTG